MLENVLKVAKLSLLLCLCWLTIEVKNAISDRDRASKALLAESAALRGDLRDLPVQISRVVARDFFGPTKDLVDVHAIRLEAAVLGDGYATGCQADCRPGIIPDLVNRIDLRIGDTLAKVDGVLTVQDGEQKVPVTTALYREIKPALVNLKSITAHVSDALPSFTDCAYLDEVTGEPIGGNPDCVFNRFQGTSKSAETAFRNVSLMSTSIQAALGPTLDDWHVMTTESADASREAHQVLANFSKATKPLPAWVRIGVGLAPPLAQTGFTVASWFALRGKTQ